MPPLARRLISAAFLTIAVVASACKRKPAAAPAPASEPIASAAPRADNTGADRATDDARARAERERMERERAAAEQRRLIEVKIYFDFDRSDLTAESRSALDGKLGVLQNTPRMRIRILGNTDERGSDEYNMALSQRRAAAAKRYLVQRGIDPSRIEAVSYGEERPVCNDSDEGCWSQNRRDEFEIIAGAPVASRP